MSPWLLDTNSESQLTEITQLFSGQTLRENGVAYRFDRDECHGLKELLVLLTFLYDDTDTNLIIDEPELNLHPQYQAFFMEEVRRVSGDGDNGNGQKTIFLITHSPFILDLRTEDDVKSVISFSLDRSVPPKQVARLNLDKLAKPLSMVRRLNAHHKQIFFSDNPLFVEGLFDAQLIEAMLRRLGGSLAGAGSCIIDAGGREEVNYYFELCNGLGKKAHFIYDLDSLFSRNLRWCVGKDQKIRGFLAKAGLGNDFTKYCRELDNKLTEIINMIIAYPKTLPRSIQTLSDFLQELKGEKWEKDKWATARTATMTAVSLHNDDMKMLCKEGISDAEGRLEKIVDILAKAGVHLLPNGALEIYLPSYRGNPYKVQEDAKRPALQAEIEWMENRSSEVEMSSRYGDLYDVVLSLPSKQSVDFDPTLRKYLARYIHEVQQTIVANPKWLEDRVKNYVDSVQVGSAGFFRSEDEATRKNVILNPFHCGTCSVMKKKRSVLPSKSANCGMAGKGQCRLTREPMRAWAILRLRKST